MLLWGVDIGVRHIPVFERLAAAGFDGVEIPVTGQEPAVLRQMAAACDGLVGEVVNVARGSEASLRSIAQLLSSLTGKRADVEYTEARPGDVTRHYADISKARSLLGFEPRIDLESGLERTLAWFRDQRILEREGEAAAGEPNW